MTQQEQLRRFGSVPLPDCALAKKARKDARDKLKASAINIIHGLGMGALIGAAMWAGATIGG